MRTFFLLSLFTLLLSTPLLAQEEGDATKPAKGVKHELAVNATFFIKQFLNFSEDNSIEISPYAISYKRINSKLKVFRFGLGLTLLNSKFQDDALPSDRVTKNISLNTRVGFEKQFQLTKTWSTYIGVDLTGSYGVSSTSFNNGFEEVTTERTSWNIGCGPVLGIQVHFNDRISLFTETAFYYAYQETNDKSTFSVSTFQNDTDKLTEQRIRFVLPTSLFFAVRLFKRG